MSTKIEDENYTDAEKENLKNLILYRSLYILKRKFEINKSKINQINQKFKSPNSPLIVLPLKSISEVLATIFSSSDFLLIPFTNYSELYTADLQTEINRDKATEVITSIAKYLSFNLKKYNSIFYEKKMKEIQLKKTQYINQNPQLEEPIEKEIVEYTKHGIVKHSYDDMMKNNIELTLLQPAYEISEDDVTILNSTQFIYCETLPLIIADYLQTSYNIAVIDSSFELKEETRTLFDGKIVNQLNILSKVNIKEENEMKMKNILYEEMQIEKTIKYYENLLVEKKVKMENTSYIVKMINKLREQKIAMRKSVQNVQIKEEKRKEEEIIRKRRKEEQKRLRIQIERDDIEGSEEEQESKYQMTNRIQREEIENKFQRNETSQKDMININPMNNSKSIISTIQNYSINTSGLKAKKVLSKEEMRKNAIKEIFYFYSKQHNFSGPSCTFEQIKQNEQNMDLSEFSKFCGEFKILARKDILVDLFKRTSSNRRILNVEEFMIALNKIAKVVNDTRVHFLEERIKTYKLKLIELDEREKEKKDSDDNNNNQEHSLNKDNQNNEENIPPQEGQQPQIEESNMQPPNSNKKSLPNEEKKDESNENNQKPKNEKDIDPNQETNQNNQDSIENEDIRDKKTEYIETTPNEEEKKEEKPNSPNLNDENNKLPPSQKSKIKKKKQSKQNNTPIIIESREEIVDIVNKMKDDCEKLKNKTNFQLQEELYNYLDIDCPDKYRKKMVGFTVIPFRMRDPSFRFDFSNNKRKYNSQLEKMERQVLLQKIADNEEEKRIRQQNQKEKLYQQKMKKLAQKNKVYNFRLSKKIEGKQYKILVQEQDDYIKQNKENKISWNDILNYDCDKFLLNDPHEKKLKRNSNVNTISNLFKSNSGLDSDDEYLLNHLDKKEINENKSINIFETEGNNNSKKFRLKKINNQLLSKESQKKIIKSTIISKPI